MQTFADQRVRPFAELLRHLFELTDDNSAAITDVILRANGLVRWNDNRIDGPPHLLQSGASANPDDMKKFKSLLTGLLKLKTGTFATLVEANSYASDWVRVQDACVRPSGG